MDAAGPRGADPAAVLWSVLKGDGAEGLGCGDA
jgi:hypothetical protein